MRTTSFFKKQLLFSYCFMVFTVFCQANVLVLDNGVVRREIDYSNGQVSSRSISLPAVDKQYIKEGAAEFSVLINDELYTGLSKWHNIQYRDTSDLTGGKGYILSFESLQNKNIAIELHYLVYPELPVIRKALKVINTGEDEMKVERVDVESFQVNWSVIESWVMRQYARYKWLGPYCGNWDDPLLVVHDLDNAKGIALGNEAVGVIKRTAAFEDGKTLTIGLTHPDQNYSFRKWLHPGEQWISPWTFIALYDDCPDGSKVINTTVPDFVRRHMDTRIERLAEKPMFVYNTWFPFYTNIDETLVRELAKAASECGVEEFVIDDGWQINIDLYDGKPQYNGDWEVNKQKFPNGLRPVFDYIKQLGMKPGLWVTLATADPSSKVYKEHPEWFVKDARGNLANLHTEHGLNKTACMGTDWYDYIKATILRLVHEHGLMYLKLDLAIEASAYVFDTERTGCHATNHPYHRDREESYEIIYKRCMQLFDELHAEAPDLFIDCTFETAGKMQLMDYGIARHAEGNWLSNIQQPGVLGPLRVRNLSWGRSPVLPATSLVIGNLRMNDEYHELGFKSLTGSLPIMLGDPRKLTTEERKRYKSWTDWIKQVEKRHAYMSFRQDLPGFGEPMEGAWDGFCRLNTETTSGGLVGIFKQGAKEDSRMVVIPWLDDRKVYE